MKPRVATIWLEGCSGCHMSFLDMDERLIELAGKMDLVFSPIADIKEYPENVDVALVEGAINTEEDLAKLRKVRSRTKILVSFGDCAVTANVPSMRNEFKLKDVLERAYVEHADVESGHAEISASMVFRRCYCGCGPSTSLCRWRSSCRAARRHRTRSTSS